MSKVLDRYASAVHSSNLKSDPRTSYSDSDVLGAAGLAGKRNALAMMLTRLLDGDKRAVYDIVRALSEMASYKARAMGVKLKRPEADDMARAVLAWKRYGKCRACGGHGFQLIPGAPSVGGTACRVCKGTTMIPFDNQFPRGRLGVAQWLVTEIDGQSSRAAGAMLAKIGLDL